MKQIATWAFVLLIIGVITSTAQEKAEFKTIDGIPHILNPAKPLKGTIKLEVERTRTINPYEQPDVGMKYISFSRDEVGSVILFDSNRAEGHRFGPEGEYLGLLTRQGQGPGEFSQMQGYRAYFADSGIWIFGGRKVAFLDRGGKFLREKKLNNSCESFVDSSRFLSRSSDWTEERVRIETVMLVLFSLDGEESAVELYRSTNVGMIRHPSGQGAFADQWGTPRIFVAADAALKRVYCGLNTEYKIWIKDYSGKDLFVIQKDHKNVGASRADVKRIMSWAIKDESSKWMLDAYPDRFVAVLKIAPLPNGYLAVFRVSGPEMFEIDVFSPKGEYLYALIPPPDVKMNSISFFSTGFATVEEAEDYNVYREYRINNLPEIFDK